MLVQKLNVDDWQLEKEKKFDGTMAYAQNKRQQVIDYDCSILNRIRPILTKLQIVNR